MRWSRQTVFLIALALLIPWVAPAYAADWTPPKDNVITEKQATNYLQVLKSALDDYRAAGNMADNAQSSAAAVTLYLQNNQKFKANLASHGMTEAEYQWVGDRMMEAWGVGFADQALSATTKGMAEQRKTSQDRIAELKTKLAAYQKAQVAGRRVMTKDERQAAIESAKNDQQSAADEAKQHEDEIKQYTDDANKADADAKAAAELAKNPPSDIGADDRPGFIESKKADAQSALDAAKEARERLDEAKKARDESLAKANGAKSRITDPDLPVTDDEKAQVKKENEDTIASINTDLTGAEQGLKAMDDAMAQFSKNIQDQRAKNPVPPQNVDVFKKHQSEWEAAWGVKADGK